MEMDNNGAAACRRRLPRAMGVSGVREAEGEEHVHARYASSRAVPITSLSLGNARAGCLCVR